jgi:hypothetical protein
MNEKKEAYTAANIQVRDDIDFDFEVTARLAAHYHRPVEFIERGFEACRLANVCPQAYFVRRYLADDKSIPINREVNAISRELQRNNKYLLKK